MRALQFPKIMEFLPILLPRHFKQLISSGPKELLEDIEEILATCPWKLGFCKVSKIILCKAVFLKLEIFCISFKGKKFMWTLVLAYFYSSVTIKPRLLMPIALRQLQSQ